MRRPLLMASALLLLLCAGCWDMRNVRDMDYVSAIGFDYRDGQYFVYAQLIDFGSVAKSEGGTPRGPLPIWIGSGHGETVNTAIHNLYETAEKRLFWGHVTAAVYSERMIRRGVEPTFDMLNRYRELRYLMWVYGTRESIEDLFAVTPFFNMSPQDSVLHNPQNTYRQSSFIRPLRLRELLRSSYDPGTTTLLPALLLDKNHWKEKGNEKPMISIEGAFAFKEGKPAVLLSTQTLLGQRWMDRHTVRSPVVVQQEGRPVAVLSVEQPKIRITPRTGGNRPQFELKIRLKANVIEMIGETSEAYLQREAVKSIEQDIRNTLEAAGKAGFDPYNLEHVLYRERNKSWHALTEQGKAFVPNVGSLALLNVELTIVHTGKHNLQGPKKQVRLRDGK